jgi:hypothetical protein
MNSEIIKRNISSPTGAAWLLERPNQEPMRVIANGRRNVPVGRVFIPKFGRALPWESKVELHALLRVETRGDVIDCRVQPFRLEMLINGKVLKYTPDRKDILEDRQVDIVEVKDQVKVEEDPLYYAKLTLAAAVCAAQEWRFRVETRAEIEAEPAFTVIKTIHRYARTEISDSDLVSIHAAFKGKNSISVAQAQAALGGCVRGFAAICAMVARRKLRLDPSVGMAPDAQLTLIFGSNLPNA